MPQPRPDLLASIDDAAATLASLRRVAPDIEAACAAIIRSLAAGGTVLTFGNGGSAAQAMHLSEELIGKYKAPRAPLRAVCLNADPTALTCIANDFGYEEVFARQLQALARPGDVAIAFSTSGNSPNIERALRAAGTLGVTRIGLLGKDGGVCRTLCDIPLIVPSDKTERIQEAHTLIIHLLLDAAESAPRAPTP